MGVARTNWAGNVLYAASEFQAPSTVGELQNVIAAAGHVRAVGSGHSFNRIADTTGCLVSVAGLPTVIDIDTPGAAVHVSGGTRYGELGRALQRAGFALHNTGSLPHISVAGASATGTHGSGIGNGNLATIVSAIEMITADGELVDLRRDAEGDRFNGMVLALGSLGVVTSLTLDLVPTFDIRQDVYEGLSADQLDAHFDEVMSSGYSVSVFTDWSPAALHQVWRKSQVTEPPVAQDQTWFGSRLATVAHNPVPGMPAENATAQLGIPGPWNERLPHFRLEFTPSSGQELQSEYLLPRRHAAAARQALAGIAHLIAPLLQISEFRTVAADDLWISPSYRTDSVAFHFTWLREPVAVSPVLTAIEERLAPFGARPHWGKVFNTSPESLDGLYERLPEFRALVGTFDPAGTFGNELVDRLVFNRS